MAEPKFTLGPWETAKSSGRDMLCIISSDAWICGEIANNLADMSREEAEANAALIAAAPDLYAALALILPLAKGYAAANPVGSNAEYVAEAEAALAKARGESFMNTPRTDGEPRPSNGGEAGPDAARIDPVIQARPESA